MLSICCDELEFALCVKKNVFTYTELLQVLNADIVAEKVDERILKHASVTVAALKLATLPAM